jgi:hypothetical protein
VAYFLANQLFANQDFRPRTVAASPVAVTTAPPLSVGGATHVAWHAGTRPAAQSEGPKAADLARFIGGNTRTALFFCACVGIMMPLETKPKKTKNISPLSAFRSPLEAAVALCNNMIFYIEI